jgi:glycosyltransferase involved in cell wall biosynthesis
LAGRQFPEAPVDDAPGVELAGVLPYDEVLDLIGTASVVVVPSIVADCSPTVVLEAMAAGRPVVASATGGIVDQVVDGVTGVLVPPEDPVALRRAIQSVLADPGMAAAMGRAGWERVREFTSSAILSRIVEVYRQAGAAGPG